MSITTNACSFSRLRLPEVRKLERAEALIDEDVVRLDVRVHKVAGRHVLQGRHQLLAVLLDGVDVDSRLRNSGRGGRTKVREADKREGNKW